MLLDHVHPKLNQAVTAIGGQYSFMKQGTLSYQGRPILYYVGYALLDTSCCGVGGVSFARVAGFVCDMAYKTNASGALVSRVEPITDKTTQKQIRKVLQDRESVYQVDF